ncbi:hypothetical protein OG520_22245 [Streptomyces sp. NBC_00984]|uniref:zinc finger domain-containing protein n=1 Tax=Streptomyces sp. NBC_00984 TaxID=2903700 RepID=UPI00386C14DD|nr:hypothetical protein OG520_22245 [Streptomyces sp. NBC_00984]
MNHTPHPAEQLLAELVDDLAHERRAPQIAADYLARHRVIVLAEGADAISALPQDYECDPGRGDAAELLRRMATDGAERPAAEIIREQRDNITFNRGDMVAALRDALLDPAQHTPASAEAAARVLLAAHTRQLAAAAREHATQRNTEMRATGDRSRTAAVTGMNTIARLLDARATLFDPQPEEQPAAPAAEQPAYRFTQLAVSCPRCKAPIGQLCTSHNGTRVRRTDTHIARSDAYHAQEAGR